MNKRSIVLTTAALIVWRGVVPSTARHHARDDRTSVARRRRAAAVPDPTRSRLKRRLSGPYRLPPDEPRCVPEERHLAADGVGQAAPSRRRVTRASSTIASHGSLVMGTTAQEGAARHQTTADDLRSAIDWAEKENARDGSPLKADRDGQSRRDGAVVRRLPSLRSAPIRAWSDRRVRSGVQPPNPNAPASPFPATDSLPKCTGPCCSSTGTSPTS